MTRKRAYRWGIVAEYVCALALMLKGYRILALRLKTLPGEIDILAARRNWLVIVEVKARREEGDALYSVTPQKQQRLQRAAEAALMHYGKKACGRALNTPNIRFDLMAAAPWRWPKHHPAAWRIS